MVNLKKLFKVITITTLLLTHFHVSANDEYERTELARLIIDLQALDSIIQSAKQSAVNDTRIVFDYASLEQDISLIQQGIQDYINRVRRDPRSLPEVKGSYRD